MIHDSDCVEPWWWLDTALPGEYSLVPILSSHFTLLSEKLKAYPFSSSSSSSTQNTALRWLPQDTSLRFDCQNVITQPSRIPEILSTPIIFTRILASLPSESQPRLSRLLWLKSYPCRWGVLLSCHGLTCLDMFTVADQNWTRSQEHQHFLTLSYHLFPFYNTNQAVIFK